MSRFARGSLVVLACAVVLGSAPARAQQPGTAAPMPLAVDLGKVAVGSQAEYAATMGQFPPMTIHLMLASRAGSEVTLEMSAEGGMMAMAGGKVVVNSIFSNEPKSEPTVKKVVMQVGENDPMEMPSELAHAGQFKKPDPKTLVGPETIKVKAGSFKTKHYREKTPAGDNVDYWVSESVPPIGLVKMRAETKAATAAAGAGGPGGIGPMTMELVAQGKGAKPSITKPAKPFDPNKFRQQVTGGIGAPPPGPAGASPPAGKK
jgi:hypothetical protein